MCFYDQILYSCRDFKWGNFRQHCQKEYRIGETCGMKLIYEQRGGGGDCRICEKIKTKKRRLDTERDRVKRWDREGGKGASVEKSQENIKHLKGEIRALEDDLSRRRMTLGKGH